MAQYRDIQLKRENRFALKQDKPIFQRAVLTDAQGNQTGSGSVWADETLRRVWAMVEGAIQPGQVLCTRISDPYIGLGVIVGFADGSNAKEVLSDDYFLRLTGDPTGWYSTSPRDLEPGGIKNLWVYSKVITPLATYPAASGLFVNVIAGDYPYAGTRKSFAGQLNISLTQNPNVGQHYYAGLYLDSANTLQVIYGASVVVASTPTEPAWPAGAFRISVVRINHTQTSIDFDTDTLDRRMFSSDENGGGGWPFDNIYTVSQTGPDADYSTITAAVAAVPVGSIILLDAGTWTESFTMATDEVAIVGLNRIETTITSAAAASTVTITGDACALYNLSITNSNGSGSNYALTIDGSAARIQDVNIFKTGAGTLGAGVFHKSGTALELDNVKASVTDATSNYGYYNITNTVSVKIFGGSYEGSTADIFSSVATSTARLLLTPNLINGIVTHSGTRTGRYTDATGNMYFLSGTGESGGVWLEDVSTGLQTFYGSGATGLLAAAAVAAAGDVIRLHPGTYTLTAALSYGAAFTIEGIGDPKNVIVNSSTNSITILNPDTAGAALRNVTVNHTGAGTSTVGVSFGANNIVIENVVINLTGASSLGIALRQYGGTSGCKVINCFVTASGATSAFAYGNENATSACEIFGGEFSGTTADVYGDQAGSTLTLFNPVLVNASKSFTGTIRGEAFDQYSRKVRVKPIGVNDGRLTLLTATPVTTADQAAKTTVYYTPYIGGKCEVYNGSFWIEAPFTELSLALTSFTADKNSDMWIYDNAGTLALERTEWTNNTTRATALAYQDGRYVKSGTTTRLYLGTFRTTAATGQCEDSVTHRYLWNYYNRVDRSMSVVNSSSHTYNVLTWRPFNNSQANSDVECVIGVVEDDLAVFLSTTTTRISTDGSLYNGVGINSTSAPTGGTTLNSAVGSLAMAAGSIGFPVAGYNFICALELSSVGATAGTFADATLQVTIRG